MAVKHTLSGRLPKPVAYDEMGEAEGRDVAWRVAAAIGNAQNIVIRLVTKYEKYAGSARAKQRAHLIREWTDGQQDFPALAELLW